LLEPRGALGGKRVVVTAGPTREAIDPVRFISNHSSGKMGVALASAAWRRGADVTLVSGPMSVSAPPSVQVTTVESTDDMKAAIDGALPSTDVLIMAAAPADFRPSNPADVKIKKTDSPAPIALSPTPDILQSTRIRRRQDAIFVGFALETND